MKKYITLFIILCITISSFAQIGFNYKALIKDDLGNVVVNQEVDIRFSLEYDLGVEFGIISVYEELHTVTTTNNGIVILNIGEGTIISGTFPQDGWASTTYMIVEIDLEQDGTFTNLGTTDFKMVPMAISARHANFAVTANTANNVTGLERITESTNPDTGQPIYGWRLIGKNEENYGTIGESAVDLSTSPNSTGQKGATGAYSTAMGYFTAASGRASVAMGFETNASGNYSTTMGDLTYAPSYAETAIGAYNTHYTPNDIEGSHPLDRVFVIGNGYFTTSDALIVFKSGIITAPSLTNSSIDYAGDKALITKEYTDSNYLNISSNLVPIAYGTIESDGNVLSGTGNFTAGLSAGVLTISVNNETMTVDNSSCLITPYSTAFRTSSLVMSGGDIQVRIFNSSGTITPTTFQFTIYKL